MMRELDTLRRTVGRVARGALGANPLIERQTMVQARTATLEGLIAPLPINTDDLEPIQDYTTGAYFFMVSYSAVGGSDPIA
jgi:hypothetical protein